MDPPFPLLDIATPETLGWCHNLGAPPANFADDVFVCSYPKSGTTWMQHIVGSLVGGTSSDHVSDRSPFFELQTHWRDGELIPRIIERQQESSRRMFNTHLRWEMMPQHDRARFVYVCRDGRDACVSFFHHLSNQLLRNSERTAFEGTFAEWFEQWISGEIAFGRWTDHIASWNRAHGDPRVLFVNYEDMVEDLGREVLRVAHHLGLDLSEDQIARLLPTFSAEYMKSHTEQFQPVSVKWTNSFKFIRNCKVGDHENLFGSEETERFATLVREAFPDGLPSWAKQLES